MLSTIISLHFKDERVQFVSESRSSSIQIQEERSMPNANKPPAASPFHPSPVRTAGPPVYRPKLSLPLLRRAASSPAVSVVSPAPRPSSPPAYRPTPATINRKHAQNTIQGAPPV